MNLIFIGSSAFGVPTLRILVGQKRHRLIGVITQPDSRKGRGLKDLAISPVKAEALTHALEVWQPKSINELSFISQLRDKKPDLIIVAAYSQKLGREILNLPAFGCINIHPSLLPKYRGAAPIQWAVTRGETRTGVTVFLLTQTVDGGAILRQEALDIGPDETSGELSARLSLLGARVLLESVDAIARRETRPVTQDESLATPAPKLRKEDGRIDFTRSAREIYNWIRGMTPVPGAYAVLNGQRLQLLRAGCCDDGVVGRPGAIVAADKKGLCVQTGRGRLLITEVKPENRKAMAVGDFLNGFRINEHDAFDA